MKSTTYKPILPPTYLFCAIAGMVGLHFILPGMRLFSLPWRLVGLVPLACGVVLNLLADRSFKQCQTTVKPFGTSTSLVTDGVYRFTRHPMYLGMVLCGIGIAALLGTATPWLCVIALAILFECVFIRVEEQMMEDTFGKKTRNITP